MAPTDSNEFSIPSACHLDPRLDKPFYLYDCQTATATTSLGYSQLPVTIKALNPPDRDVVPSMVQDTKTMGSVGRRIEVPAPSRVIGSNVPVCPRMRTVESKIMGWRRGQERDMTPLSPTLDSWNRHL